MPVGTPSPGGQEPDETLPNVSDCRIERSQPADRDLMRIITSKENEYGKVS
jgi:hypothetical protein